MHSNHEEITDAENTDTRELPKRWIDIPVNHEYLQPDKEIELGEGDTIAERLKARKTRAPPLH